MSIFAIWGVEISGSHPRMFQRRLRIGPFVFNLGRYQR